jgi:hypothetical protein
LIDLDDLVLDVETEEAIANPAAASAEALLRAEAYRRDNPLAEGQ